MRFTVITVVYNDIENLKRTCYSVANQTFDDYEHLIIDGGSTDGTIPFLKKATKKNDHIRYYSGKDKGVYDAMNKGVALAKGDYILFLNAADMLAKRNTLEQVHNMITDDTDVLYGRCVYSSGKNKKQIFGGRLRFVDILMDHYVAHQSVFAKKELLSSFPFDLKYKYQADQDFMLRVKKNGYLMKYVKEIIALYDGNGLSSQEALVSEYRVERYSILKKYCPIAYTIRQMWFFLKNHEFLNIE